MNSNQLSWTPLASTALTHRISSSRSLKRSDSRGLRGLISTASWDLGEALEENLILSFFSTDNPFNPFYAICRHCGPDLQVLKRLTSTDLGTE